MPFDLQVWRERTAQRLEVLRTQILQRSAPRLLYARLCEAALWPLVEAAQQGAWLPARATLDQVAPGVGGKLLAGQIQRWQEGADASEMAAWVAAAAPGHTALQEALDAILRQTEAVAKMRAGLPEDDRAWFERRLSEELTQLGHSPGYQAWLEGAGAVSTGETPTVFDQREQQVHTQINVAGDYDDHRQQGGHYTVVIEHASGLAIGDGAQVAIVTPPPAPASDTGSNSVLRQRLQCLDEVALDALCLEHFPAVYERFTPDLRRDEKINRLLDYCHRYPEAATRLVALLGGAA